MTTDKTHIKTEGTGEICFNCGFTAYQTVERTYREMRYGPRKQIREVRHSIAENKARHQARAHNGAASFWPSAPKSPEEYEEVT